MYKKIFLKATLKTLLFVFILFFTNSCAERPVFVPSQKAIEGADKARQAQGENEQEYKLSHLFQYVGTYKYDEILEDPYVNSQLVRMMGAKELASFKQNLNVKEPISFRGDIILHGYDGYKNEGKDAMLVVSLNGWISALLKKEYGDYDLYSNSKQGEKYVKEEIVYYISMFSEKLIKNCWEDTTKLERIVWAYYPHKNTSIIPRNKTDWYEIDFKKGKLEHLVKYIGNGGHHLVLEDAYIKSELTKMMGDDLSTFQRNFDVFSFAKMMRSYVLLSGNLSHQGGSETSLLLFRITDGEIIALLQTKGDYYLYTNSTEGKKYTKEVMDYIITGNFDNKCWRSAEDQLNSNIKWRYYDGR